MGQVQAFSPLGHGASVNVISDENVLTIAKKHILCDILCKRAICLDLFDSFGKAHVDQPR
jgi:hypothetical protein